MKLISVIFIFSLTMSAAHASNSDQINPNSSSDGNIAKENKPESLDSKKKSGVENIEKPQKNPMQAIEEQGFPRLRAPSDAEGALSSAETYTESKPQPNAEHNGSRTTNKEQQKETKKDLKRTSKGQSSKEGGLAPEAINTYSLIFKMMEKPWEMNGSGMMGVENLLPMNEMKNVAAPIIALPPSDDNSEQSIKPNAKDQSSNGLKNTFLAAETQEDNLFDSSDLDFDSDVFPLLKDTFDEKGASQAVNGYPEGSVIIADLDESYDDETAADDSDAQSFLSDDASEIRDERPEGFTLSLGAARPWQWLTFSYAFQDNSLTLGGGKTTADVIAKSNVINLNLSHYAAGVERRWFPVDEVPFGLFYGVTLGQWQGTTKRSREQAKSYSGVGISSFVGLGLHIQRKNGWFWGANILGLYKTFVVSQSGNALGGDVRGYIEDQKALGLPNISVGWFLP